MSDQGGKKEQKINIEVDESTAQGVYSNLAIINHSLSEFIVDFITIMPGAPKAKVSLGSSLPLSMPKGSKRPCRITFNALKILMVKLILRINRPFP